MNDVERGQNNEENIIWKAPHVGENYINNKSVELGRKKDFEKINRYFNSVLEATHNRKIVLDVASSKIELAKRYVTSESEKKILDAVYENLLKIRGNDTYNNNDLIKLIDTEIYKVYDAFKDNQVIKDIIIAKSKDESRYVNRLLYYTRSEDIHNEVIDIHLLPAENKKLMSEFMTGLKELATIIDNDKSIEKIVATSWIVAKHPKILQSLGFTVSKKPIDGAESKYFGNELVASAYISRENFLSLYLKK